MELSLDNQYGYFNPTLNPGVREMQVKQAEKYGPASVHNHAAGEGCNEECVVVEKSKPLEAALVDCYCYWAQADGSQRWRYVDVRGKKVHLCGR